MAHIVVLSDESGDDGLEFKTIKEPGALRKYQGATFYKVAASILTLKDNIPMLVTEANKLFSQHFSHKIRKWADIKKEHKNQPALLKNWLKDWFEYSKSLPFVLLSMTIIDKQMHRTSKDVSDNSVRSYVVMFKRIFPFIKKLHYEEGDYKKGVLPVVEWYNDVISNRELARKLNEHLQSLADIKKVHLIGPSFINKPREYNKGSYQRNIALLISVVDFIAGIVNRFLREYYLTCRLLTCSHCLSPEHIDIFCNPYIEVWQIIHQNITNFAVTLGENEVWSWNGLFYLPPSGRDKEARILGVDPYFTN